MWSAIRSAPTPVMGMAQELNAQGVRSRCHSGRRHRLLGRAAQPSPAVINLTQRSYAYMRPGPASTAC